MIFAATNLSNHVLYRQKHTEFECRRQTQCAAIDDLSSELGLDGQTGKVEDLLVRALDFLVYGTGNTPTTNASLRSSELNKELVKQEYAPRGIMDIR